jgi:hypothetical protein
MVLFFKYSCLTVHFMCLFRTFGRTDNIVLMKRIIKKLLLRMYRKENLNSTLFKRILNIKAIWNNDHQDDNGIEKLFDCFFLALNYSFLEFTLNI